VFDIQQSKLRVNYLYAKDAGRGKNERGKIHAGTA
jgi:hypothetical protein